MKDIKGYEGIYKISEDGQVWSCYYKKFLSPFDNGHGYLYVVLNKDYNKVKARVHRLVAEAYVPNPKNLPFVVHKDGNKLNNSKSNLEYCTYSENNRHAMLELNKDYGQIAIRQLDLNGNLIATYPSIKEAHRQTNIEYSSIAYCVRGVYKTSGGYHWERATTIREEQGSSEFERGNIYIIR